MDRVLVAIGDSSFFHSGGKGPTIIRGSRVGLRGDSLPLGWGTLGGGPVDRWTCPVAMPTLTFGAVESKLRRGASFAKYMFLAPESTTSVDLFATTAAAYVWMGGGLAGKVLEE